MYTRIFLRMARWARRPPSRRQLVLFFVVLAACLTIWGIEQLLGWPDWLTPNRIPRPGAALRGDVLLSPAGAYGGAAPPGQFWS